jgi:hypothetical protein
MGKRVCLGDLRKDTLSQDEKAGETMRLHPNMLDGWTNNISVQLFSSLRATTRGQGVRGNSTKAR